MARPSNKIGLEEKGQRAARSTNVYLPRGGLKEVSICRKCGAIYRNKRWCIDEAELKKMRGEAATGKVVCPACQRMEDHNPAGVVTLRGDYMLLHENEILNIVKHVEAKSRAKNPLGRIMDIQQEHDVMTIGTTEDKLAQKLGREIYKAHKGELHYQWSHDQQFVRVNWSR
jgi:NMD protein affecting ribosome stability and mRNA decay